MPGLHRRQLGTTPAAAAEGLPGAANGALPSYIPLANGPKPDYHSSDPRVSDGFDNFPKPYQSWTKAPPGTGSNVNVYAIAYYPPPTPYDQNPTWHEVNKQLNANVQMTIFAGADNPVKFPTLMAGKTCPTSCTSSWGLPMLRPASPNSSRPSART